MSPIAHIIFEKQILARNDNGDDGEDSDLSSSSNNDDNDDDNGTKDKNDSSSLPKDSEDVTSLSKDASSLPKDGYCEDITSLSSPKDSGEEESSKENDGVGKAQCFSSAPVGEYKKESGR